MSAAPLETLKGWLAGSQHTVFLAGAGLSVASGIRPYRGAPNAVWEEYVTDWGTVAKFRADPALWWAKFWLEGHGDIFKQQIEPNEGHRALAKLCSTARDALLITQNIDGLSRRAGHPEERLIEIHGRYDRFVCVDGCEGVFESADLSRVKRRVPEARVRGGAAAARAAVRRVLRLARDVSGAPGAPRARRRPSSIVFVGTSFSVGITEMALRSTEQYVLLCLLLGSVTSLVSEEPRSYPEKNAGGN